MHSDVQSENPGKCPKCKMDLVKSSSSEGEGQEGGLCVSDAFRGDIGATGEVPQMRHDAGPEEEQVTFEVEDSITPT